MIAKLRTTRHIARKFITLSSAAVTCLAISNSAAANSVCQATSANSVTVDSRAVDLAWSSTRVNLDLLTQGQDQLVAYYNATRNMVVAHRRTTTRQNFYGTPWSFKQLDTMLGWDNHNSVVVGVSPDRHFHVTGNMHANQLVYYKTERAGDIRTLKRVDVMVDPDLESRVTYPNFFHADDGTLLLRFRYGGSGNGNEVYYRYDPETSQWAKAIENGFTDGEGLQNAYISSPVRGPDGKFHIAWVWRTDPGSTMNTMVSYARTRDYINWEDAYGSPLTLPIRLGNTPVAAPVPLDNGMINGHQKVGFDPEGRPLVTYVQYDENKIAQAYIARFEGQSWEQYQLTKLDRVTHAKNRRGTLAPTSVQMRFSPEARSDGTVAVDVHLFGQPKTLMLDGETLELLNTCDRESVPAFLKGWGKHDDERLNFRWMETRGTPHNDEHRIFMSWHVRPGNRDRGFENISDPSTLRIHVIKTDAIND